MGCCSGWSDGRSAQRVTIAPLLSGAHQKRKEEGWRERGREEVRATGAKSHPRDSSRAKPGRHAAAAAHMAAICPALTPPPVSRLSPELAQSVVHGGGGDTQRLVLLIDEGGATNVSVTSRGMYADWHADAFGLPGAVCSAPQKVSRCW